MAVPNRFQQRSGRIDLLLLDADFDFLTTPPVWLTPTLLNSWANHAGFATVQYSQAPNGMVTLKGSADTGVSGTIIFNLPAGFRPAAARAFPIVANTVFGFVTIDSLGNVQVFGNPAVSLDGISFLGEV